MDPFIRPTPITLFSVGKKVRVRAQGKFYGYRGEVTKIDDGLKTLKGKTIANIQVQLEGETDLCRFSNYDLDLL